MFKGVLNGFGFAIGGFLGLAVIGGYYAKEKERKKEEKRRRDERKRRRENEYSRECNFGF